VFAVSVKRGPSIGGSGGAGTVQRLPTGQSQGQGQAEDKTAKLFKKYSGGDLQMDAAEFARSLTDILGKGMRSERRRG